MNKSEYIKKYREENKEVIAIKRKEYYNNKKLEISKQRKEYYQKNKKHLKEYSKNYRNENPEKVKRAVENWRKINKDKDNENSLRYYYKNKEKISKQRKGYYQDNKKILKEYSRKFRENNYEEVNKSCNTWKKNNREKINKQTRKRRTNDLSFNISANLRGRLREILNKKTKEGKIYSSKKYGIDYKAIIEHLKPLPKNLTGYEIHHIKPLNTFKLVNSNGTINYNEIKKAFAPENHKLLTKKKHREIHKKNGNR